MMSPCSLNRSVPFLENWQNGRQVMEMVYLGTIAQPPLGHAKGSMAVALHSTVVVLDNDYQAFASLLSTQNFSIST